MPGKWLDQGQINQPGPGTYTVAANITGDPTTISGIALYAAYYPWTITNSATLLSPTAAVELKRGGAVTNLADGEISGGVAAVDFQAAGTVVNAGDLNGGGNNGVVLLLGGGVTNQSDGTIRGLNYGVVFLSAGGTIVNRSSASIRGVNRAIDVEGSSYIYNNGSVSGGYGIVTRPGSQITNAPLGTVSAVTDAVFLGQFGYTPAVYGSGSTGTVTNQGTITASGSGSMANGIVLNLANGTVDNSGTIIGSLTGGTFGLGVALNYGGSLLNTGSIQGGLAGVSSSFNPVNKGTATITNQGTVQGTRYGIRLAANGLVTNAAGTILSSNGSAIDLHNGGTVVNHASIVGATGIHSGLLSVGATTTITNYATIAGTAQIQGGIVFESGGILDNRNGATISATAGYGVWWKYQTTSASMMNAGVILTGGALFAAAGVYFGLEGGSATNAATGTISGVNFGVLFGYGGTLLNQGSIASSLSTGGAAVSFGKPSIGGQVVSFTNASHATISGANTGVRIRGATIGSFVNYGFIGGGAINAGYGMAVTGIAAGVLTNAASGTITGAKIGVLGGMGALTLYNAGTISGSSKAVAMRPGYANQLLITPGAVFNGFIDGGNTAGAATASSLVLLASAGAVGVLSGLGPSVYNFTNVTIAPGATWQISGSIPGIAGGETFTGFAAGDSLDIAGTPNETIAGFAANTLTLSGGSPLYIIIPGPFTRNSFLANDDDMGGTLVQFACFAAGTRIRAEFGDLPVERLHPGMRILTIEGGFEPIVRVRRRHVDCAAHPRPETVYPVRVRAGAFGPGRPSRDLWLSPDHAVFVDGVPIPVRHLINGETIRRWPTSDITYYHVQLPGHEVIMAENLPVESYLDPGIGADAGGANTARAWEMIGRAPLIIAGPLLDAIRLGAMAPHEIVSGAARAV